MNAVLPSPPIASIEAEQALLGAILVNNEAFGHVVDVVKPECFFDPFHGTIFDLVSRQIKEGRHVTPVTLRTALPEADLGGITVSQYLARLAAEATTIIGARDYARAVRDAFIARRIIAVGESLRAAPERAVTTPEALDNAWSELEALRTSNDETETKVDGIGAVARRVLDEIAEVRNGTSQPATFTGLVDLSRAIGGGYRPGRLYVIAGRPGMGKTVFGLSSARRVAKAGHGVLFISLEIDDQELGARVIADELARTTPAIPYRDILTGQLDDRAHERVAEAALSMETWPLQLDYTGALSMAQIEARARLTKERMARRDIPLRAVFIDYLGLIKVTDRYRSNAVLEIGEVALAAKQMSKRLDVAVILLSQLNRGVEGREDKRPTMADLRQSGNIEEHADVVALCYRPAYYLEKSPKYKAGDPDAVAEMAAHGNDFELIIDKNRLGPTGTRTFWCNVALNAVDDISRG